MNHIKDIETMRFTTELQTFDRKSARIDAKALAIPIVAFANADGGDIAIGIEDKGDVTGIDGYEANVNELLRAPFDYCVPTVSVDTELMDCVDVKGNPNHILIMHVLQSNQLHANQADDVYYRIGDKSKKMNFEQRTRLMYAKGARFFEDAPVRDATVDDIDLDFMQSYIEKIGYGKSPMEYLLGNQGRFVTIPELPEFCWTELIINGIGHRDYSIMGTDIQIKMFDDHFVVESPGMLPGIVRTTNIREIHFSRNPKIFEFLHEYGYVKEFGEGVDRMYREMSEAGLPEPEYRTVEFMVFATLKNHKWVENQRNMVDTHQDTHHDTHQDAHQDNFEEIGDGSKKRLHDKRERLIAFCAQPRSQKEMMQFLDLKDRVNFRKNYLTPLLESGRIERTLPDKPTSKNQRYVRA